MSSAYRVSSYKLLKTPTFWGTPITKVTNLFGGLGMVKFCNGGLFGKQERQSRRTELLKFKYATGKFRHKTYPGME